MKKLPKAIGPYSPYRKKGKFLVTSGQLPINPETNTIEATTVYDQVLQCLE
ncbi:MAG: Rid family hydrolase, partial [Enterococcus hulanensis]